MMGGTPASSSAFGANDHWDSRLSAEHIAVLAALVGDLVHCQGREIDVHDLRHWTHPSHGSSDSGSHNGCFGDGRINDTPFAKFLEQTAGRAVSPPIQPHVFAKDEDSLIPQHLLTHRLP